MRGRLGSAILAALGATLLVTGVILAYANGALFDPGGFADRSLKALDTKEVRAEASKQIIRQIAPAAEGLPQATGVTNALFDFPPFRGSLRFAAKTTQRAVLDRNRDHLRLALPDVGSELRDAVSAKFPAVAQSVDPGADATVLKANGDNLVLSAVRTADDISGAGIVLIVLGVILGLGAVAFAMRRAATVIAFGVVLGWLSLVGIVALILIRGALLSDFHDPGVHDAIAGIWAAFFDDLKAQLALLTGGGFALAIGALIVPRVLGSNEPPAERPHPARAID